MSHATWTSLFHKSKSLTIVDKPSLEYIMARRTFRKKAFRKRTGRKAVKRFQRKASKKGLHVFKLRGVYNFATSLAGDNSDVLSMTNPGAYLNGASALPDLSSLTALFDNGRICAIKVKYIPMRPFDASSVTNYLPCYIVPDFDDETALAGVAQATEYERMKVKDLSKPWSYYIKVPKIGSTVANSVSYGWYDLATMPNQAGIKFYATGLNTSASYGTIIATYYVAFKNRR